MVAPQWITVIGTALGLGIVHVMTGPDHLSALSTLSVGKPLRIAFGLGVRWGCGHSFGLLIVAIIFFALGQGIDLDVISYYADMFVGIFMILLGAWYTIKAFRERKKYLQEREDKDIQILLQKQSISPKSNINNNNDKNKQHNGKYNMDLLNDEQSIEMQPQNVADNNVNIELQQQDKNPISAGHSQPDSDKSNSSSSNNSSGSSFDHALCPNEHSEQKQLNKNSEKKHVNKAEDVIPDDDIIIDGNEEAMNPLFDTKDANSKRNKCIMRITAFVAGIFHGIAGPGGVLGVMVALQLNDWFLSSLYLILFFLSSIVTMGCYAVIYGYCTTKMAVCANNQQKCAFILKIVSAVFSLLVGVLWLTLTFTGSLNDAFE